MPRSIGAKVSDWSKTKVISWCHPFIGQTLRAIRGPFSVYPYKRGIITTNQYQFERVTPNKNQQFERVTPNKKKPTSSRGLPRTRRNLPVREGYPEREETSEFQRFYLEQEDKSDNNPSPSDPVSSCVINLHVLARDD